MDDEVRGEPQGEAHPDPQPDPQHDSFVQGDLFDAGILSGGEARPGPWQRYISELDTNAGGEAMSPRVITRRAS